MNVSLPTKIGEWETENVGNGLLTAAEKVCNFERGLKLWKLTNCWQILDFFFLFCNEYQRQML